MSYLFDLEDFDTFCRPFADSTIKQMASEEKTNQYNYYQQNGTYDGYTPKQDTLFFNSDGTISIYLFNKNLGVKTLFDFGEYCCTNKTENFNRMSYILKTAQTKLGLFPNLTVDTFYWDAENQSCRWKPLTDACSFETYKIALNPVFDDGALFAYEKNDKTCNLTIDFSYLFKFDCEAIANTLVNPNTDQKTLENIKRLEGQLANKKTECETLSSNLTTLSNEYNNTNYSLENNGLYFCIDEGNNGLAQLEALLGPLKYKKFINGEPNSYSTADFLEFSNLNTQSINKNNIAFMHECEIPYGTKSELKKEIDELMVSITKCQSSITVLETQLANAKASTTKSVACSDPLTLLETFDTSVTLDVIESDGSLTTVTEFELLPAIGRGNLYNYLVDKKENSGFYFCSLPKSTETWTTGCTSLIGYELTAPEGLPNTSENLNVSTCNTVKDSLLGSLLTESPFGTSPNDIKAFNQTLYKNSFASNWLNFSQLITDETIINKIKNKKIKLSVKINNSCSNVCIYIDNIKLTKECVNGEDKKVTINKSPGFELEKIIDNKKSWVNNTIRVNRDFEIENINNLTVFRQTDYDVNDERLVINTKEIDLNINIASAIENDVQCFLNDNPNLLEAVPSNDCGCDLLACYEDVFNIISYSDAVDSGIIPSQIDPADLMASARAIRDAWLKAWNELMLATPPYLDIVNGVYNANQSEETMTTYLATKDAYLKALHVFNLTSGGGFIEGLTVEGQFPNSTVSGEWVRNNYSSYEKVVPQMFNTKCGKIFKRNNGDGYIYFVETPEKELRVFWVFEDFGPRNTTWIEITSLVQEDYAPNWDYGMGIYTPEKASFFCKWMPNNYTAWVDMMSFHYQNNNNAAHNQWVNPVEDNFFIEWDSTKNKCMTNMYNEVVPEQFSMHYPITSLNFWTNYGTNPIGESPQCDVDVYLRNSGTTACTSVDFTWPNIAGDIMTLNRAYRDANLKLSNEIKLTERTPIYNIYIIDPATNMLPDETSGYIPVKVTTTVRKNSRDGNIVFKEEYILNDPSAICDFNQPNVYGLSGLRVSIGITDPNSAYWNPNGDEWNYTYACTSTQAGTLLSGNTSTLPLAGASDNGIDRNWEFDENYYVHFDVVNNDTNYVYYVTNNDYNLKDRTLPIVCPSSASTQTFNITTALDSINTFKTTILGQIQEDLDNALGECTIC